METIRTYAAQLSSVVEYLHCEQKVIHRDLKPQNILLTDELNLKVIDFGDSKKLTEEDISFEKGFEARVDSGLGKSAMNSLKAKAALK